MSNQPMSKTAAPAVWLIVLIAGISQLSETVYTPSLPRIAKDLQVEQSMVEYTLTVYLIGLAVGVLFWGNCSDRFGRKPCLLVGFAFYIIGCLSCYSACSISMLMVGRSVQAFGASAGSVLGQAICRDSFQGPQLGKVYAAITTSFALFPALGPIIGGVIANHFGWPNIFLSLICAAIIIILCIIFKLPETLSVRKSHDISIIDIASSFLKNKKLMGLSITMGVSSGINFSYFAEGSFDLISLLGLSVSQYGLTFIAIAISSMSGSMISRTLQDRKGSKAIIKYGRWIIMAGSTAFLIIMLSSLLCEMPRLFLISVIVVSQMVLVLGISLTLSNVLAIALVDYTWCIGTASSLFSFIYSCITALVIFVMGMLHNGTLLTMPLYFFCIGLLLVATDKLLICD